VVLLPGATQLQAKDIAWRLKASQADCVVADPETAIKVSHSKKVLGFRSQTPIHFHNYLELKRNWYDTG